MLKLKHLKNKIGKHVKQKNNNNTSKHASSYSLVPHIYGFSLSLSLCSSWMVFCSSLFFTSRRLVCCCCVFVPHHWDGEGEGEEELFISFVPILSECVRFEGWFNSISAKCPMPIPMPMLTAKHSLYFLVLTLLAIFFLVWTSENFILFLFTKISYSSCAQCRHPVLIQSI